LTPQWSGLGTERRVLGDRNRTGCAGEVVASFGPVEAVGVEGTGSYSAALTAVLQSAGQQVIEVHRPSRAARRLTGKSDVIDAEQAARSVLAAIATAAPKSKAGPVEVIRMLRLTRSTAVKAKT
jgi:transposase